MTKSPKTRPVRQHFSNESLDKSELSLESKIEEELNVNQNKYYDCRGKTAGELAKLARELGVQFELHRQEPVVVIIEGQEKFTKRIQMPPFATYEGHKVYGKYGAYEKKGSFPVYRK